MIKVPFTVSARAARLIGRENVANAEGALIELVKNCYDADSEIAVILIDKENDTILIVDSGEGMTEKIIKEQWMTIGTDEKLTNPTTTAGRIKSGAKGIGRFALDRLGEKCTMITFPKFNTKGYKWVVNWSDFEQKTNGRNKKIDQVYASLDELKRTTYKKQILSEVENDLVFKLVSEGVFDHGTLLKITGLRDQWEDKSVGKVYENLELLTPPDGEHKISIWLISGSQPNEYGLVENSEFNDYDYKLVATYKKNRKFEVKIEVFRNEFDLNLIDKSLFKLPDMKVFPYDRDTFKKEYYSVKRDFSQLIRGFVDNKRYASSIGDFQFTFYFLKNNFSKDDKAKYKYKEFRGDRGAWLKKFGGIKLYRDDFRVRPYGEMDTQAYDWLGLGERHGQNPAGASRKGGFRVRANQVAGRVKISRLTNPYLEDKSSREGILENEVFEVFKNLLKGIIKVQEDDRSTIFSNLLENYRQLNPEQGIIEESGKIASEEEESPKTLEESKARSQTLKKGILVREEKLKAKDEEVAISRAMASAGILIASFSHEFHGIKNHLISRTTELKKYLKPVIDYNKLNKVEDRKNPLLMVDEMQEIDEKLRQWIEFAIGLTLREKRRPTIVKLVDYFYSFISLWQKLIDDRGISFKLVFNRAKQSQLVLNIAELDLDTVFDNLLTNSIEAFQRNHFKGRKEVAISLEVVNDKIRVIYRDSGPGIDKSFTNINDIFNPFETSKRDDLGNEIGTGLGMWLVKSTLDSIKAQIELKKPRVGFETEIFFNLKKQNA